MGRNFEILGRILLLRIGAATLSMKVSCHTVEDPRCTNIAYVPPQKRTADRLMPPDSKTIDQARARDVK